MKPHCFSVYHQESHVCGHKQMWASFHKQVRFPLPHILLHAYAKLACKPTFVSHHTPKVFLAWPCPATYRYFNLVEASSLANYFNAPVDHNVSICHCVSVLATDLVVSALTAPVDTLSAPSPASDLVNRTPLPLDTALSTTSLLSLNVPMSSPLARSSQLNGPQHMHDTTTMPPTSAAPVSGRLNSVLPPPGQSRLAISPAQSHPRSVLPLFTQNCLSSVLPPPPTPPGLQSFMAAHQSCPSSVLPPPPSPPLLPVLVTKHVPPPQQETNALVHAPQIFACNLADV